MSAVKQLARRERKLQRRGRGSRWLYLFGWCGSALCERYGRRPNLTCLAHGHKFIRRGKGSVYQLIERERSPRREAE